MQRLVRKLGLPAIVTAYVALFCGLVAIGILALGYHDQLDTLRTTIYHRCQQRDAYDRASQQGRQAMVDLYQTLIAQEQHNRFIDAHLRDQRVAAYRNAVAGLERALAIGAPQGCSVYR